MNLYWSHLAKVPNRDIQVRLASPGIVAALVTQHCNGNAKTVNMHYHTCVTSNGKHALSHLCHKLRMIVAWLSRAKLGCCCPFLIVSYWFHVSG